MTPAEIAAAVAEECAQRGLTLEEYAQEAWRSPAREAAALGCTLTQLLMWLKH